MGVVQIVLNNTLAHYGALSIYGSDIPLACAGIISKVNMIFIFCCRHFAGRTADHRLQLRCCALPPRQELSAGAGCGYRAFSGSVCLLPAFPAADHQYFRHRQRDVLPVFGAVLPHFICSYAINGRISSRSPPTSSTRSGKARLGVFMSLTRQILFLPPLIVIFPLFMGIDGVMYAGPIADGAAAIVCGLFTVRELRN